MITKFLTLAYAEEEKYQWDRTIGFGPRLVANFGLAGEVSMVQVSHGDIVVETSYAGGAVGPVARHQHR